MDRHKTQSLLKDKLINAPILVPPDWDKTFHVDVDVSKFCIGLVLSQKDDQKKDVESSREELFYHRERSLRHSVCL
jgi:hypothetical protein